jgi:protein-tyrosine-phosphatase
MDLPVFLSFAGAIYSNDGKAKKRVGESWQSRNVDVDGGVSSNFQEFHAKRCDLKLELKDHHSQDWLDCVTKEKQPSSQMTWQPSQTVVG